MLLTGWIFEEDTVARSEGDSPFSLVGFGRASGRMGAGAGLLDG